MTVYERMDSVLHCDDMETGMKNLLELAVILDKERYTSKLLGHFYERIQLSLLGLSGIDMWMDKDMKCYCIEKGAKALSHYIAITIPRRKKPKQTLKELKEYANTQMAICKSGDGKLISAEMIEQIMEYLDESFHFSDTVFKGVKYKTPFLILNMKNINHTSECMTLKAQDELGFAFFFYLTDVEADKRRTPEEEVFYVLSLALIAWFTGSIEEIPGNMIELLKKSCIPTIEELGKEEQVSALAELLSVGLMYDSPFQKYDTYDYIHGDDKKLFRHLAEKMFEIRGKEHLHHMPQHRI